jgi:hypothetical protein
MDPSNPYTPPASRVAATQPGVAGSTRILLVCLVVAQLGVALLAAPGALRLVRYGAISLLSFLAAALATGALAWGGANLLARRDTAKPLVAAAALGLLTAIQWHPPFVLTGIAISSLSALVVFWAGRPVVAAAVAESRLDQQLMDRERSRAYERFVASTKLGYDAAREPIGYDFAALDEVTPAERDELEAMLIANKDRDGRDRFALARIGSPRAWDALLDCTKGPDRAVRFHAASLLHAAGRYPDLSDLVVEAIHHATIGDGFSEGLHWAERYRTPKVITALLQELLNGANPNAVQYAALLYWFFGKAREPFDWTHRPFFLKFLTTDPGERRVLFDELCATLGIEGKTYGVD